MSDLQSSRYLFAEQRQMEIEVSQQGTELTKAPEITLIKSEMEAAAARVAERAMNTTLDGVSGILSDIFGGLFGDSLKQWRTRRLVAALAKTREFLEAAGIPIENAKSLPMGELYAMFEGCSKQEDVSLTEMWAALLANAMNPSKETYIDPSFARILGTLSGLDALILKYISEFNRVRDLEIQNMNKLPSRAYSANDRKTQEFLDRSAKMKEINDRFFRFSSELYKSSFVGFSSENISFSLSNLLRLGLIYSPDERVPENLVQVGIRRGGEILITDDTRLRTYLKALNDQVGMAIEKKSKLQKLVQDSQFNEEIFTPAYALSGFANRFLEACSP